MQAADVSMSTSAQLFKAIEAGEVEAVRGLLADDPSLVSARRKDGVSALSWAAYYRQPAICELFLGQGANPDVFEAATLGLMDRLERLLKADPALVQKFSPDGWTPLHLAAHFGKVDAMRLLLSRGADHRAVSRNSNGNQPLQAAAAGGSAEAVELLIKARADPNHKSHGGYTALDIAAQQGDLRMIRSLLDAKADVNAHTDAGKTALDFAIEANHEEAVDLLERAGATSGPGKPPTPPRKT
jgi:uncharacterized protein